ncbi:MAG: phosphoribosylformylglycinamidine cyclo-ligase [Candidatus Syntrophosphaera sp.]
MTDKEINYRSSGVDVVAGERAVISIKKMVKGTYDENVLSDLGSFGGLYRFSQPDMKEAILVASTDGVGTKLRLAVLSGRYDTVGQDLVNHCVNDILVQGARPLFFLDYIGLAHLDPNHVQKIISGMVKACRENSCSLIGGEMAEMPGIYHGEDFDLVGTIIGVVDKKHLLPGDRIKEGDILAALPSSGLHTNGYSLARKILFDHLGLKAESFIPELGASLADLLLAVHSSYLGILSPHLKDPRLHGLAHITGGGIPGNLKRIIPEGLTAHVEHPEENIPPLFRWLGDAAKLSHETMLESFNLGVGMIAVLDPSFADDFLESTPSFVIGVIKASTGKGEKVIVGR